MARVNGRCHCKVAICTERVEAKRYTLRRVDIDSVAICTERVEAKYSHYAYSPLT